MDVVSQILPEVRAALTGIPGGTVRKGTDNVAQPVPSWWLQEISSARLNSVQDLAVPELHIWESSRDRMNAALAKVEQFRDFRIGGITYNRESITKTQEDVGVFHAVVTWSCPRFAGVPESGVNV